MNLYITLSRKRFRRGIRALQQRTAKGGLEALCQHGEEQAKNLTETHDRLQKGIKTEIISGKVYKNSQQKLCIHTYFVT